MKKSGFRNGRLIYPISVTTKPRSIEDDISDLKKAVAGKQDTLVSGENIATINGHSIVGGDNIDIDVQSIVRANEPYPESWKTDGTMAELIADINADDSAVQGKIYLATVYLSDLPASMIQAEMKAEIMTVDENLGKNILFTITSSNTAPYHWEYSSAYGSTGAWRSFTVNNG